MVAITAVVASLPPQPHSRALTALQGLLCLPPLPQIHSGSHWQKVSHLFVHEVQDSHAVASNHTLSTLSNHQSDCMTLSTNCYRFSL